jgi:hypothetical protein
MCTLLWVVGGLMLAKLIMFRCWRRLAAFGGYGGCGRGRWHHRRWGRGGHGTTILIGGLDHDWSAGGGGGFRMRHTVVGDAEVVTPSSRGGVRQRLAALWKRLELNQRQREEVDEVVAILEAEVGRDELDRTPAIFAALRAISGEAFSVEGVRAALGPLASKSAVDALEHLHYVLTPEQRALLRL